MANEILHGRKTERDNGFIERNLALYFDLTSPDDARVKDDAGQVIATQSSSRLPAFAADAWSQTKKDAIDAGDAAFHVQTFVQSPGETAADLLSRIQAAHPLLRGWWSSREKAIYENQGLTRDA